MRDDEAMEQALTAGAAARRRTAPNPWVGCALLRDGEIVGLGATEPPGRAHAEVGALARAGDRARGATAYVTLEPCSHHGRTPPCVDALIDAGVTRVVAALEDPDPRVAGSGFARLRAAGIEVTVGVGAGRAMRELAPYLHHRRTGRPFVVAKVASSVDGRVAAADGTSKWLTGELARSDAHELRADSQAIMVGAGTAIADQPRLTARDVELVPEHPPTRVLLDARGRVPASGPLFDVETAPTLVVTSPSASSEAIDSWRAAGAKVEQVAASADGAGVDLDETLDLLGREGVLQVLVEGGGALLGSVFSGGHAQRLVVYVAPLALGARGTPALAFSGPDTIADARRYELTSVRRLGPDARLDYDVPDDDGPDPDGPDPDGPDPDGVA
jgi:diaminohydroxyphosphoribosylaminopyrimidine deaminase / 5-amino-6-(5-phosphoribosylamino)uracil reductase